MSSTGLIRSPSRTKTARLGNDQISVLQALGHLNEGAVLDAGLDRLHLDHAIRYEPHRGDLLLTGDGRQRQGDVVGLTNGDGCISIHAGAGSRVVVNRDMHRTQRVTASTTGEMSRMDPEIGVVLPATEMTAGWRPSSQYITFRNICHEFDLAVADDSEEREALPDAMAPMAGPRVPRRCRRRRI